MLTSYRETIATFLHIKNVGDKLLQNKFISNASSLYKHRYTIFVASGI
jgi:hypothetical protein